ncbi:amino acid permease/ SLC12A domain-containing protein [Blyttiomyces helicus]|uniref:Amino acid permease/ SLC12A domain-containing protein n=1 Tax=Blyttiomyces helicus TaxID=388810 RepID=A0A4P9WJJ2_9FUNG|nr:amino acid permease/ SLC12A domain-containing protein [Blyttiomyces helicus]|eukprot:RKO91678.1 amino acid permease/ SLC12A domain-containing protein [Blyttiomyces helicus]
MIAIGGTIGTGLFLSSGGAIATAGPLGALIAYAISGLMVYFVVSALGEMATFMPISGSFNAYATRFVSPALGFTAGWTYWASWALTVPIELTAAAFVLGFWVSPDSVPNYAWWIILIVLLFALNMAGVALYGEMEYVMAFVKVLAIIFFIIVGILVDAGALQSPKIGFDNWTTSGAPLADGVAGIFTAFTNTIFAYGGTELVGITAGEAANPRKSVPKAINGTFWRILIFYLGAIFILGLVLNDNTPNLSNSHNDAVDSPFTLALKLAGLSWGAHLINSVVLIAVLSAANSAMFAASRTLMAMALEGKAPALFARTTKQGVPFNALLITTVIASLSFLSVPWGAGVVFNWLQNIISCAVLMTWLMIFWAHIRFRAAFKAQGRSLDDLPYKAVLYPYGTCIGILLGLVALFGEGYVAIWLTTPFNIQNLLQVWIGLPCYPILYFGYTFWTRTRFVPLEEVDLVTDTLSVLEATRGDGLVEEEEEAEEKGKGVWGRLVSFMA